MYNVVNSKKTQSLLILQSLLLTIAIGGCGAQSSEPKSSQATDNNEAVDLSNLPGESLFVVSSVPPYLSTEMTIAFNQFDTTYPSSVNYHLFDSYREAALSKYQGATTPSEISQQNVGYFQSLAIGGPFDDATGSLDSKQPLSWRQLSRLVSTLIVRISDPNQNVPQINICSSGYFTAVKGQILVDGSPANGVALEFFGCKATFDNATFSGRLSGFYQPGENANGESRSTILLAADNLEMSNELQSLAITGAEFLDGVSDCAGDVNIVSNLHVRNNQDGREVLMIDRLVGGENPDFFAQCDFTIELANTFHGVVFESERGQASYQTTNKLFELNSESGLVGTSRRHFDRVNLVEDAKLTINGDNNTSGELTFHRTGETDRDVTLAQLETLNEGESTSLQRASIESFAHNTWISDTDSDLDNIPDRWETLYGLDPYDSVDASSDADYDSLTNLVEYQHYGNPRNSNNGTMYDRRATIGSYFQYFGTVEPTAPLGITGFARAGFIQSEPISGDIVNLSLEIIGPALFNHRRIPSECEANELFSAMECEFEGRYTLRDFEFFFRPHEYGEIVFKAEVNSPDYDGDSSNNLVERTINYQGQGL